MLVCQSDEGGQQDARGRRSSCRISGWRRLLHRESVRLLLIAASRFHIDVVSSMGKSGYGVTKRTM